MHTFQQNQTVSETVAPPVGAMVSPALAADAPHETVAVLLETAENAEQKRRVLRKARTYFLTSVCVLYAAYIPLAFANISHRWSLGEAVLLAFAYLIHVKTLGHLHTPKFLQNVANGITQFPNEPRLLLPLIDALHVAQPSVEKSLLYSALTERLWNLPASDAALSLDDTRRAVLRNWLTSAYGRRSTVKREANAPDHFNAVTTDLAVAIMRTLAGIGDKKSVKILEKIIEAEAVTPNETVVRDAAREYLPALVQKIAENQDMQTKLDLCLLEEKIREPRKVLEEFVDTLAPEPCKVVLVEFLRKEQHSNLVGTITVVGLMLCALAPIIMGTSYNTLVLFLAVCGHLIFCAGVLFSSRIPYFSPDAQKVVCELSRNSGNDTRLLPLLLQAARSGRDAKQSDTVKKALARLLPLLQPGDAALVPPTQRAYLRSWLKLPRSKKKAGSGSQTLTIIALNALATVGDTKALPAAAHIARQTRNSNYRETELHEAAVRCVEALEARKG